MKKPRHVLMIVMALTGCTVLNSGCAIVGGVAAVAWAADRIDKAHKAKQSKIAAQNRAIEEQKQRDRVAAAQRKERERIARAEQAKRDRIAQAQAEKRRAEKAERDRQVRIKRAKEERIAKANAEKERKKEEERQAQARRERRERQARARQEKTERERRERIKQEELSRLVQKVRDNMAKMQNDITYRGVDPERLGELATWEVPPSVAQEYFIVHGLYAWHLHLRSGDSNWKEVTNNCFRQAKEMGDFNAFTICPDGWTVDTRIMWEK